MLEEYTSAFSGYLRTGTVGALSEFCAEDADLSRLRVYRNGFLRACIEALRANYPSVERLVGEERFPALARPYVETHPPCVASLVEYGEVFPHYIDDSRQVHQLDYLASFAALDRAWTEVCFSEDNPAEDASSDGTSRDVGVLSNADGRLAPRVGAASNPAMSKAAAPAVDTPDDAEALMNLCGRLSPWVRLVLLDYRVLDAWGQLRQGGLAKRIEIPRMPQRVLLWRSGAEMLYRDLTLPEHAFVAGVAAGQPFGEAAGAALDVDGEFDLVATFAIAVAPSHADLRALRASEGSGPTAQSLRRNNP